MTSALVYVKFVLHSNIEIVYVPVFDIPPKNNYIYGVPGSFVTSRSKVRMGTVLHVHSA